MKKKDCSPVKNIVVLGDDENAVLCALLIAHKLNMLEVQIVLVKGEHRSSEEQLKTFSSGIRELHSILELDEKELLRDRAIRYVYGAEFFHKNNSKKIFLPYDSALLPKPLDDSLMAHAFYTHSELCLDDISLSALAHKTGRFVDPELIQKWPFNGLRTGMLVDVNKYLKFLSNNFKHRGGRVEVAKSVSIGASGQITILSGAGEVTLPVDLIIDFSPASLAVNWDGKFAQEKILQRDRVSVSKRTMSYGAEAGGQVIDSAYHESVGSDHVARITFNGISQVSIFSGDFDSGRYYEGAFPIKQLHVDKIDHSDLFAPHWFENVISFPRYSAPPWDSVMSLNDWIGSYLINIINLWPRVSSIEACAMEFNRLGDGMAFDYFELAAVYCKVNNIEVKFPCDIDNRADRRIQLFKYHGVVPEPESDLIKKSFWNRLMSLFVGFPSNPAGMFSKAEITYCIDQLQKLKAYNAAVVSKMPQYHEFINYIISR